MVSLKTRLLEFLDHHIGLKYKRLEPVSIFQKTYHLIKGTFREKVDYDDAWLMALGNESFNVFDVGCNIGQSTILLLHPGKIGRILLIDPNPEALSQAAENMIRNELVGKAQFICAFASDKPKEKKEFYTVGAGAAGSMYSDYARTASKLHSRYMVPTVTLDDLSKEYGIIPDLVKIDVEGAELLVLEGAVGLAKNQMTRFFVEMHSGVRLPMIENASKILLWCNLWNYRAWYLKKKIELTNPDQVADRGRCHLLLLPSHMKFPSSLMYLEQGDALEKVHFE
jgi:FkbM family methyltransferase